MFILTQLWFFHLSSIYVEAKFNIKLSEIYIYILDLPLKKLIFQLIEVLWCFMPWFDAKQCYKLQLFTPWVSHLVNFMWSPCKLWNGYFKNLWWQWFRNAKDEKSIVKYCLHANSFFILFIFLAMLKIIYHRGLWIFVFVL